MSTNQIKPILHGILFSSNDNQSGTKILFEYPVKYFYRRSYEISEDEPQNLLNDVQSICGLFFKQKKEIMLAVDNDFFILHKKIILDTENEKQTRFLVSFFVDFSIANDCFKRDSINSCLAQLVTLLSIEEKNSNYLTKQTLILDSIYQQMNFSNKNGSFTDSQIIVDRSLESSSLASLFYTLFSSLNYYHNVSLIINNTLLFSYTFPLNNFVPLKYTNDTDDESNHYSQIDTIQSINSKENTISPYLYPFQSISINEFKPYHTLLLSPSFPNIIQSMPIFQTLKFRQFLNAVTPLVSFEYISELLCICIEDLYYIALITIQTGYAELIYVLNKDTQLVLSHKLDFSKLTEVENKYNNQFKELCSFHLFLSKFTKGLTIEEITVEMSVDQKKLFTDATCLLYQYGCLRPLYIYVHYLVSSTSTLFAPTYVSSYNSSFNSPESPDSYNLLHLSLETEQLSNSLKTQINTIQNTNIKNDKSVINKYINKPFYSLLCLCYPYLVEEYSIIEISYLLAIPYQQILSLCFEMKNELFLYQVYIDIPQYVRFL
ncbi:hypothetical protein WA158_007760 [Blastocystis sp. Blastoise]